MSPSNPDLSEHKLKSWNLYIPRTDSDNLVNLNYIGDKLVDLTFTKIYSNREDAVTLMEFHYNGNDLLGATFTNKNNGDITNLIYDRSDDLWRYSYSYNNTECEETLKLNIDDLIMGYSSTRECHDPNPAKNISFCHDFEFLYNSNKDRLLGHREKDCDKTVWNEEHYVNRYRERIINPLFNLNIYLLLSQFTGYGVIYEDFRLLEYSQTLPYYFKEPFDTERHMFEYDIKGRVSQIDAVEIDDPSEIISSMFFHYAN